MKKIIFGLIAIVMFVNLTFAQSNWKEVGKIENGKPILTIDKESVIKSFNESLLKFSNIDGKFTDVKLISTDDKNFLLVFSGPIYRSTVYARRSSRTLAIIEALTSTSCTTSECSTEPRGCVVMYDSQDIGYCSPCGNGGGCTKTSTGKSSMF
jgi:hypothetical protein